MFSIRFDLLLNNPLMCRTYLEQGARKKVLMSDKVYDKLKKEKERPKTPTLKECQHHLLPSLDSLFKTFWEVDYVL